MQRVLVAGAGKIGSIIAQFLANTGDYFVILADQNAQALSDLKKTDHLEYHCCDLLNEKETLFFIRKHGFHALVSCLPYYATLSTAQLALQTDIHYFGLTEDINASHAIAQLATHAEQAFIPHCGIAPGFINIVAHDLIGHFDQLQDVKLRCGALPQATSNILHYALMWSVDGLINEYDNPCRIISQRELTIIPALENLEEIQIEGASYEAFTTSGGIGTLIDRYLGLVDNMDYKTIRYPGHCEKMRFLIRGLKLGDDRLTLKKILERALPTEVEDLVIVYVSVTGKQKDQLTHQSYVKKFYPKILHRVACTAIQATTASGACAVIDLVLNNSDCYHGFITQEMFHLEEIYNNRFGNYFLNTPGGLHEKNII